MSQQDLINAIVREVLAELNGSPRSPAAAPAERLCGEKGAKLDYRTDYPMAQKRPELVKTASGKSLSDITLEAVMSGAVKAEEIRITPQTLEYQAQIGESIGRPHIARNLRRAGEMTAVPDARILEIYNALRPNRSSKAELLAIAQELESTFGAKICAGFVREAAEVYERRDVLRKD
ncbi:diol dehydratase small subunit [Siculibacillus lacustris]|uniref:Diol dehydratase small subunit n=1 Tax=Siculibacillus lacustris TaxID=1549641 RepID=A0A4Q9VMH7_9HYPH|nr:diol dehydratase small subunit [Siculibacillus lacustris]TBW36770.1 diol dehydratase small subunit [Siculibacillus lacustris]